MRRYQYRVIRLCLAILAVVAAPISPAEARQCDTFSTSITGQVTPGCTGAAEGSPFTWSNTYTLESGVSCNDGGWRTGVVTHRENVTVSATGQCGPQGPPVSTACPPYIAGAVVSGAGASFTWSKFTQNNTWNAQAGTCSLGASHTFEENLGREECTGTICCAGAPSCSGDNIWNQGDCSCSVSPLVISLTSEIVRLTDAAHGVIFDLAASGRPRFVAWTVAGDLTAFLGFDRNANGRIDDGSELFGSMTSQPTPVGGGTKNGFKCTSCV
jgi:hypothetical protein